MFSLSSLIEKNQKKIKRAVELDAYSLIRLCSEILEEVLPRDLLKQVKVVGYKNGVIKIQCAHPAFGMQFCAFEEEILDRMNTFANRKYIDRFFVFA